MDFAALDDSGKSLVVSGSTLQADARGLEIGIFIVFVVVLAWGVSGLFGMGLEMLFGGGGDNNGFDT